MPSFDREGALRKAEKAMRQGRIDAAIQEYARVVEAQPQDWTSANALGDLYVRAGQVDRGIAQYARIADHLAERGFYPKAVALYKKILKLKPADEHALLQSGEIAAKQGLLADAKQAFSQILGRRQARNDKEGAAEMTLRLRALEATSRKHEADVTGRVASASPPATESPANGSRQSLLPATGQIDVEPRTRLEPSTPGQGVLSESRTAAVSAPAVPSTHHDTEEEIDLTDQLSADVASEG